MRKWRIRESSNKVNYTNGERYLSKLCCQIIQCPSANIRNCSDFKVYCWEVNAYLLTKICKQFCIFKQVLNLYYYYYFFFLILNLCYIFIQYPSIGRYYCFLYCRFRNLFNLQFLTGEDKSHQVDILFISHYYYYYYYYYYHHYYYYPDSLT